MIGRTSLKMAGAFVLSYIVSASLCDVLIFFAFPSNIREITSIAALMLFPSDFGGTLVNLAIYISVAGLFVAVVAWLLRKVRQDIHLRHTAIGRWVLLGILLGLTEFREVQDTFVLNILFGLLLLISYWLAFYRLPPQSTSL